MNPNISNIKHKKKIDCTILYYIDRIIPNLIIRLANIF